MTHVVMIYYTNQNGEKEWLRMEHCQFLPVKDSLIFVVGRKFRVLELTYNYDKEEIHIDGELLEKDGIPVKKTE